MTGPLHPLDLFVFLSSCFTFLGEFGIIVPLHDLINEVNITPAAFASETVPRIRNSTSLCEDSYPYLNPF